MEAVKARLEAKARLFLIGCLQDIYNVFMYIGSEG